MQIPGRTHQRINQLKNLIFEVPSWGGFMKQTRTVGSQHVLENGLGACFLGDKIKLLFASDQLTRSLLLPESQPDSLGKYLHRVIFWNWSPLLALVEGGAPKSLVVYSGRFVWFPCTSAFLRVAFFNLD